jgi:hypothetical protein
MRRVSVLFSVFLCLSTSCSDRLEMNCFERWTAEGVLQQSCPDGQWRQTKLDPETELPLLSFPFPEDLLFTPQAAAYQVFPRGGAVFKENIEIGIISDSVVAMKVVIVDEYQKPITQRALLFPPGLHSMVFPRTLFQLNVPYRVYYALYSRGNARYHEGFGNFLMD